MELQGLREDYGDWRCRAKSQQPKGKEARGRRTELGRGTRQRGRLLWAGRYKGDTWDRRLFWGAWLSAWRPVGQSLHLLPLGGRACMWWPQPACPAPEPSETPAQGPGRGSGVDSPQPAPPHLQQLEHSHGLQDAIVVLQQAALGDARPAHDVVQHGLHHALAHQRVQLPVHDAPRAAEEADGLTVPAVGRAVSGLGGKGGVGAVAHREGWGWAWLHRQATEAQEGWGLAQVTGVPTPGPASTS